MIGIILMLPNCYLLIISLKDNTKKKLDVDNDGFVGMQDLTAIFEGAKQQDILKIIEESDLDQDGYIGFQEFKHAMEFEPAYPY